MSGVRWTLVPFATQRVVPWRNGLGSTREVAVDPTSATVAGPFTWRISRAQIAADGPFSRFPGIDRSLWLAAGPGLELDVDGQRTTLALPFARIDFAGECTVHARLLGGPIEDLNVMVDRARCDARTEVLALAPGTQHFVPCRPLATTVVVALAGAEERTLAVEGAALGRGGALRGTAPAPLLLSVQAGAAPCRALVASFLPRP